MHLSRALRSGFRQAFTAAPPPPPDGLDYDLWTGTAPCIHTIASLGVPDCGLAIVAELLNKLLIEHTKSRLYHSNDNGLVESKKGAVIRKHMGYLHIQAQHAQAIHDFYRDHLNPYLNFHRSSGQAKIITDAKGKQKRIYGCTTSG